MEFNNKKEEIIDGITVVHTGEINKISGFDGEQLLRERLEMYDSKGNKFYSHYNSIEEAEKAIKELKAKGITAIIGPKAPVRDYKTGEPIKNKNENHIGIYIVDTKTKEKENNNYDRGDDR